MKRTFQLGDRRLWSIELKSQTVTVRWGVLDGKEQVRVKKHPSEWYAKGEFHNQVREKLAAGYRETTPYTQLPPLGSMGVALEDALADDPDDLAGHMAYADWLSEQAEPLLQARGEFVRVQLALEGNVRGYQKRKLTLRQNALLAEHEFAWLGVDLAKRVLQIESANLPSYLRYAGSPYHREYRRGWLSELVIDCLTAEFARSLCDAPAARLLRLLVIEDVDHRDDPIAILGRSKCLGNVRELQLNGFDGFPDPTALIAALPRIEELNVECAPIDIGQTLALPNLAHLRRLVLSGLVVGPLRDIANNKALRQLQQLHVEGGTEQRWTVEDVRQLLRSPNLSALEDLTVIGSLSGDDLVREIVASGILRRLKKLDLTYNGITDEGARQLAACPDLGHLEELCLQSNNLTQAGRAALRGKCGKVLGEYQMVPMRRGRQISIR